MLLSMIEGDRKSNKNSWWPSANSENIAPIRIEQKKKQLTSTSILGLVGADRKYFRIARLRDSILLTLQALLSHIT